MEGVESEKPGQQRRGERDDVWGSEKKKGEIRAKTSERCRCVASRGCEYSCVTLTEIPPRPLVPGAKLYPKRPRGTKMMRPCSFQVASNLEPGLIAHARPRTSGNVTLYISRVISIFRDMTCSLYRSTQAHARFPFTFSVKLDIQKKKKKRTLGRNPNQKGPFLLY